MKSMGLIPNNNKDAVLAQEVALDSSDLSVVPGLDSSSSNSSSAAAASPASADTTTTTTTTGATSSSTAATEPSFLTNNDNNEDVSRGTVVGNGRRKRILLDDDDDDILVFKEPVKKCARTPTIDGVIQFLHQGIHMNIYGGADRVFEFVPGVKVTSLPITLMLYNATIASTLPHHLSIIVGQIELIREVELNILIDRAALRDLKTVSFLEPSSCQATWRLLESPFWKKLGEIDVSYYGDREEIMDDRKVGNSRIYRILF